MRKYSKLFVTSGLVGGSAAVGLLIGWLAGNGGSPPMEPIRSTPTPSEASSPKRLAEVPPLNQSLPPEATSNYAVSTPNGDKFAQSPAVITNWEDRVNEIVGSEADDTNKVQQLYGMFSSLPAEGQVEVARHLSNLVPDKDYTPLGRLLKNAQLQEPVLEVLMADVLGRPNSLKLPMLLEIAQNPHHVKNTQAKEELGHCLDGDYADDWAAWRLKMEGWLKDNPD